MKKHNLFHLAFLAMSVFVLVPDISLAQQISPSGGWHKYEGNPVLGNKELGTCFDVNVISQGPSLYNMYFSWRPKESIAITYSEDGTTWTEPEIVLPPDKKSGWEDIVNRTCTLYWNGQYHMWYTGQARGYSKIGYAVSDDGIHFTRVQKYPVMVPQYNYEGFSVMNPYVIRDEERGVFRMYYASGETIEPNVICVAESVDGINWERSPLNPIFIHGGSDEWDQDRVGGCEVHRCMVGGELKWVLFYIGYSDIDTAAIGCAISDDGLTGWERMPYNPIACPDPDTWDADSCYKPTVAVDAANGRYLLWYNGRRGSDEYIGLVIHDGLDLAK